MLATPCKCFCTFKEMEGHGSASCTFVLQGKDLLAQEEAIQLLLLVLLSHTLRFLDLKRLLGYLAEGEDALNWSLIVWG